MEGCDGVYWFKTEVMKKMGNGMGTSFWKDKWLSEGVLRDLFPRLFVIWNKKNIRVGELWNSRDDVRSWTLT